MSEENVETFKRGVEAYNRRDIDAMLDELDPDVEWHSAVHVMLGGEAMVYRGEEGMRDWFRDMDETFAELQVEFSEVKDLGDRIVATGRIRTRGKQSGAEVESSLGYLAHYKNGKATEVRTYLDPAEALKAAGLSE
jgi:ketosteroid isomerase-like protein